MTNQEKPLGIRVSSGSRRRIREAVVQFLYAANPGSDSATTPDQELLSLLLEPLREKAIRARSKALLHLQQGRGGASGALPDLLHRLARLELKAEDGDLGDALRELGAAEEAVEEALAQLRHEMNGNKSPRRLQDELENTRRANRRCRTAAARISASDPGFPAFQQLRNNALALWESLSIYCARAELALTPEPGAQPELRALVKAEGEIERTSQRICEYLSGVRTHLAEIDQDLASVVENYAPERIAQVDRAILRLAAYELLFDPEIPPAVAINEAIELARSFGTTESPRFINGVLDRLAKEKPKGESSAGADTTKTA